MARDIPSPDINGDQTNNEAEDSGAAYLYQLQNPFTVHWPG
jgi:hypothetical protein